MPEFQIRQLLLIDVAQNVASHEVMEVNNPASFAVQYSHGVIVSEARSTSEKNKKGAVAFALTFSCQQE
jgi:hypothetical protein